MTNDIRWQQRFSNVGPWRVDLLLRQELPGELDAHVQRVGRRIWAAPATTGRP